MSEPVTKFDLDRALKQRDLIFLSDQISNENLSPDVRSHLAGIIRGLLTGQLKRPSHRPRMSHSSKKTWKIALRVVELRRSGWDKMIAAVKKAAEEFDCSESKVRGCVRELRKVLREIERDEPFDWYRKEEERREERREEERREEELEEERREEEWREEWNAAEQYLIETKGDREYTDKEIEEAMSLLENERRHCK